MSENVKKSTMIIAEIGLNHNGDYEQARQMVIAAAEAGVNAVKFQNFRTEDFLSDRSMTFTYQSAGETVTEPFFDMCKRNEFNSEWLPDLVALSKKLGVEFLSTPTSLEGIADLVKVGCSYIKNGSDYLTHIPLLRAMGETGMTVIISTGMSGVDDIDAAMAVLPRDRTIVLHCTSAYPTLIKDVNLRRMTAIAERYGMPVGFSDHTAGWQAAVQAVTLGAVVIEKHFTLDHDLPGPDHWFSSTPDELATLIVEVRKAEVRLGLGDLTPADIEAEHMEEWRIGVQSACDLESGHILSVDDVVFRKPAEGILPKDIEQWYGRRLNRPVAVHMPLQPEYFCK